MNYTPLNCNLLHFLKKSEQLFFKKCTFDVFLSIVANDRVDLNEPLLLKYDMFVLAFS